jgi:hypothetical protein
LKINQKFLLKKTKKKMTSLRSKGSGSQASIGGSHASISGTLSSGTSASSLAATAALQMVGPPRAKFTDDDWFAALDAEEGQAVVEGVLRTVLANAQDVLLKKQIERAAIDYASSAGKDIIGFLMNVHSMDENIVPILEGRSPKERKTLSGTFTRTTLESSNRICWPPTKVCHDTLCGSLF